MGQELNEQHVREAARSWQLSAWPEQHSLHNVNNRASQNQHTHILDFVVGKSDVVLVHCRRGAVGERGGLDVSEGASPQHGPYRRISAVYLLLQCPALRLLLS